MRRSLTDKSSIAGLPKASVALGLACCLILDSIAVLCALRVRGQVPWAFVLSIWMNLVVFGLLRFRERAFLLTFLLSFGLFLLGAETLTRFFGFAGTVYGLDVDRLLILVLITGLLGIFIGYAWFSRGRTLADLPVQVIGGLSRSHQIRVDVVQSSALLLFLLSYPFALLAGFRQLQLVARVGYLGSYTERGVESPASLVVSVSQQMSLVNFAALAIYLGAIPAYGQARLLLGVWSLTLVFPLIGGQRGPLVVGLLLLFGHSLVRSRITPSEPWLTTRKIYLAALSVPLVFVVLKSIESGRGASGGHTDGSLGGVADFIMNQGVTSSVIAHAIEFSPRIPDQLYLLEFTHRGLLARLLDIPVLQGNSLERAFGGGSFAHSVSYVLLGDRYLAGAGSGSSFLAEAYFDGGLVCVLAVSIIFGAILAGVDGFRDGQLWLNGVRLLIVPDLLWAPRGSATAFISTLIAPSTVVAMVFVVLVSLLRRDRPTSVPTEPRQARGHRLREALIIGASD